MSDDGNTLEVIDGGLSEPPCESIGLSPEQVTPDPVNSPPHYKRGNVELVDIIEHIIADYPSVPAYHVASTLKYLGRAPYKGNMHQDLKKGLWHLRRAVEKAQ